LVTTPVARFVSAGRSRRCSTLQYFQVLARSRALGSADTHFPGSVRVTRTRSFSPREIVVLTSTVAQVNFWSRFNQGLDVPAAGFSARTGR
jgi:alkylhydroperoxidase family enzyme